MLLQVQALAMAVPKQGRIQRKPKGKHTHEASEHGASLRAEPVGLAEMNDWLKALKFDHRTFQYPGEVGTQLRTTAIRR